MNREEWITKLMAMAAKVMPDGYYSPNEEEEWLINFITQAVTDKVEYYSQEEPPRAFYQ
jgi:hypothetical protein